MSDLLPTTLTNLTYEVTQAAAEQLALYQRLHQVAPNIISASDVQMVEQRLKRLRSLFHGLQKQAKQD